MFRHHLRCWCQPVNQLRTHHLRRPQPLALRSQQVVQSWQPHRLPPMRAGVASDQGAASQQLALRLQSRSEQSSGRRCASSCYSSESPPSYSPPSYSPPSYSSPSYSSPSYSPSSSSSETTGGAVGAVVVPPGVVVGADAPPPVDGVGVETSVFVAVSGGRIAITSGGSTVGLAATAIDGTSITGCST